MTLSPLQCRLLREIGVLAAPPAPTPRIEPPRTHARKVAALTGGTVLTAEKRTGCHKVGAGKKTN